MTRPRSLWVWVVAAVVCLACSERGDDAGPTVADALYRNARIYTVDANRSWADAMAVADGRILAVGSDEVVSRHRGEGTVVHDLGGSMVLPGIHDTHIHPLQAGAQELYECGFRVVDLDQVLETLEGCLADTPTGEWVRGGQWHEAIFPPGATPKTILDAIAPDHPVFLMDWTFHNAWVNSRALERLGIDDATPDPTGGVIVRDRESGEATGILLDNAAYERWRELPAYSVAQHADALAWAGEQIARYGVTTFREAATTRASLDGFRELEQRGVLALRVKTSLSWKGAWARSHKDELDVIEDRARFASDRVDPNFAKIMLDGFQGAYTAALLEPYAPSAAHGADHRGDLMHAPDVVAGDVVDLDRQGLTIKMHATGDRAVRAALDAVEAARAANGDSGLVHEVSHAMMIHADDLPRFAALNVAAEMCPALWYPIPGLTWETWLGPERAKVWPVRTLFESGALVIYGSDWPVVPLPNPWPGIEAMVTRRDPNRGGPADWPEQAVDLATALVIFTRNGAVANKMGERSGSLEAGKDADFIVLDRNLFDVPIEEVGETQVVLSVVGGEAVVDRR